MASADTWQTNDKLVPKDNPTVARIMEERGIGRRRAYALAKRMAAESVDVSGISTSQKEAVLLALVNHKSRNARDLKEAMRQHDGSDIDGHDTAKMLWAAQKAGWVKFRESPKRGIYAIKVTQAGYDHVADMEKEEPVDALMEEARQTRVAAQIVEEAPKTPTTLEERPLSLDPQVFAHITALLETAKVAKKLSAAARLLEEAGEEDMALQVMEKATIGPLEQEVVYLCECVFGKVE